MTRLLLLVLLFTTSLGLSGSRAWAQAADGLPPRPAPFRFVNDQAQLMAPADAKKLEGGLRRYADNTGTQVVVVTVPSLGGRDVADYGRALGTAWGVGQRDKNNGVVVLVSAQEHKVTVQAGSGLKSSITPEVTSRIIAQMTPSFKQGNYFGGLRAGLNTLMVTANPASDPRKNQPAATAPAAAVAGNGTTPTETTTPQAQTNLSDNAPAPATTNDPIMAPPPSEPVSSGPGMGTLLIGALVVGAILWFLVKMFRGRGNNAPAAYPNAAPGNAAPNFLPNRPNNGPTNGPAGYGQAPGGYGPGYGQAPNSGGGMGMGGMLATGAAAAAGAYIGNRMASGHDTSGSNFSGDGANHNANLGAAGAGAAGTGAAGDYFSGHDTNAEQQASPDYFSGDNNAAADNSSSDYFSSDDNSSYDDTSSSDTGGGGFDGGSGDSGSW